MIQAKWRLNDIITGMRIICKNGGYGDLSDRIDLEDGSILSSMLE
jgi:hypothetical protein